LLLFDGSTCASPPSPPNSVVHVVPVAGVYFTVPLSCVPPRMTPVAVPPPAP